MDSKPGDVVPLFPLVYSDCVQIMTHQGNRVGVGDEKKVADHILFAEMFLPSFGNHLYWASESNRTVEIVPFEPHVEPLGERRFKITYHWKTLEPITRDLRCFVHFTNPVHGKGEDIAFQNDHALAQPTSRWPVGETIEDRPHTVEVPADFKGNATIEVGLLDGGQRVPLAQNAGTRRRYTVGRIRIGEDGIVADPHVDTRSTRFWHRADGGCGQDLCETDCVIKNVWEVLSPLNIITAEMPLDDHEFLTPDRTLQRTRFGDVTITVFYGRAAEFDGHAVPAYGFVVESPTFLAFCATRHAGLEYDTPTLFTARTLDGRPLTDSDRVRLYHGFGDTRVRVGGREFTVERETIVSMR